MNRLLFFLFFFFAYQLQALTLKDETGHLKQPAQKLLQLFDIPSDLPFYELAPLLQQKWLQANKERWEFEQLFEDQREAAFPFLQELGFIETIHAEQKHYSYALVLGATGKTMQRRLDFLYEEWQRGVRFDQIVLLTGQRDLNPMVEAYPENLQSETELFIFLFDHHPLKWLAPMVVVDSPKQKLSSGEWRRPNTADTIRNWLATYPKEGTCLAISTQPFVGYQEAVLQFFLPDSYKLECVGPGNFNGYANAKADIENANCPYPVAIYLDSFAKWVQYVNLKDQQ